MSGRRRSVARTWLASLLACTTVALGGRALAESRAGSSAVALSWTGPGPELTCLGEDGLARAVDEYVGRDVFATGPIDSALRVSVERLPDRHWHARLELSDRTGDVLGSRELTSTTELCSSLDEPLVLTVALLVDDETEPAAPESPAPEPPPPEPAPPPPLAPPHRAEGVHWLLDAALAVESGLEPRLAPGLALGVELRAAPWFSARAGALGFLPAEAAVTDGAGVHFAFLAGTLELCTGAGTTRSLRGALCVGPVYGVLSAKPKGLTKTQRTSTEVLALSAGLRGAVPLAGRWTATVGASALFPHRPDRFVAEIADVRRQVFRLSSPSVVATAGVGFLF